MFTQLFLGLWDYFVFQLPVATALTYDRTPIENRPMYVSKCEDRSKVQPQFKVTVYYAWSYNMRTSVEKTESIIIAPL